MDSSERPDWLETAGTHIREHYPADGVALSVLYELAAVGFDLPDAEREVEW